MVLSGFVAGFAALLALGVIITMIQEWSACVSTDHISNALIGQKTSRNGFFGCLYELWQMAFGAALLAFIVYIFGKDVIKEWRARKGEK